MKTEAEIEAITMQAFEDLRAGKITRRELARRINEAIGGRRPAKVIVLRMHPEEYLAIKQRAGEADLSMNAYVLSCCGF